MKAVFFVAVFAIVFVNANVLCTLCVDLVNTLEKFLTEDHIQKIEEYIDNLCSKASGYIAMLCTKVLDFGLDKLVQLIESNVDANTICEKIHAC
ncbi:Invapore A [Entamoeba marina]